MAHFASPKGEGGEYQVRKRNSRGAKLGDCTTNSATEQNLFAMMSNLTPEDLRHRVDEITDLDTKALAEAHLNALELTDWTGPVKE